MWENTYTGELYDNLIHAIVTIIEDMIHCKGCRTIKMFNIRRCR